MYWHCTNKNLTLKNQKTQFLQVIFLEFGDFSKCERHWAASVKNQVLCFEKASSLFERKRVWWRRNQNRQFLATLAPLPRLFFNSWFCSRSANRKLVFVCARSIAKLVRFFWSSKEMNEKRQRFLLAKLEFFISEKWNNIRLCCTFSNLTASRQVAMRRDEAVWRVPYLRRQ